MKRTKRRAGAILIPFFLMACAVATNEAPRSPAPTAIQAQSTVIQASTTALTGRFAYNTPDGNLWAVDAAGAHRVQLTHLGGNDFDTSWSPDGSQLVFRTSRGHYAPDRHGIGTEGIFIVAADGSTEHQLYPIDPADR